MKYIKTFENIENKKYKKYILLNASDLYNNIFSILKTIEYQYADYDLNNRVLVENLYVINNNGIKDL
jgi:hypothetical protein